MSEQLAAINVLAGSSNNFLHKVVDDGEFVTDLAAVGLRAVITTKASFRDGKVKVPTLSPRGVGFKRTEVDPADLTVVHNRLIARSGGYLADIPTLNEDELKAFAAAGGVTEACRGWLSAEGGLATLPDTLVQHDPSEVRPNTELRCYAVLNGDGRVDFETEPRTPTDAGAEFADTKVGGQAHLEVHGMANQIVREVAERAGVERLVGSLSFGYVEGDLMITRTNFRAPELPTTAQAPVAARGLFRAIARNLADMRS